MWNNIIINNQLIPSYIPNYYLNIKKISRKCWNFSCKKIFRNIIRRIAYTKYNIHISSIITLIITNYTFYLNYHSAAEWRKFCTIKKKSMNKTTYFYFKVFFFFFNGTFIAIDLIRKCFTEVIIENKKYQRKLLHFYWIR